MVGNPDLILGVYMFISKVLDFMDSLTKICLKRKKTKHRLSKEGSSVGSWIEATHI